MKPVVTKISSLCEWNDFVLPPETKHQFLEICNRIKMHLSYESMDLKKHRGHKDFIILFSGPTGTGKTMAAQNMAGELNLDIYRIDLSTIVNKYIGETEKILNNIFKDAEDDNAVLLFDEADALFGEHSEVKDAHGRYANIEINYLLQKIEEHKGIVIVATNKQKDFDDAFLRRMDFIIEFPIPKWEE